MTTRAGFDHELWFSPSAIDSGYLAVPKVREGTWTFTADEDDETSWDSAGWEESYPGVKTGTLSFTMWKDEDNTTWQEMEEAAVLGERFWLKVLDSTTGDGIAFLAYFTSFANGAPERGRATTDCEVKMAALPVKVRADVQSTFASA
jgi:hypothetical protein